MNHEVTELLTKLGQGDDSAFDSLLPIIYQDLRGLARNLMRGERKGHTLQTTALVHEAYLRLSAVRRMSWQDRSHFLRVAARAMRRVLVDHARRRERLKRGGGAERLPLDQVVAEGATLFACPDLDILTLNWALDRLEQDYPRAARVVELVYFAGLSHAEAAEVARVSRKTVDRDWLFARAWLLRAMRESASKKGAPRHPGEARRFRGGAGSGFHG